MEYACPLRCLWKYNKNKRNLEIIMKKIAVLIGPNGVGKSTATEAFMQQQANYTYIESNTCRAINPFPLTLATKKAVIENIYCLFRN